MKFGWFLASVVLLALLVAFAHAAADDLADEFLGVNESDPIEWNNKGVALYNQGNYDEALICFEKALEIDPNFVVAWNKKGVSLYCLGRYDDALICIEKALEIDPKYVYAWYNKGVILCYLDMIESSLTCFDEALEIDPNLVEAWNDKGNALGNLGRPEDALICIEKALEIDPKNANSWNSKGTFFLYVGNYEDALICFDKALEINPNYAEAWVRKGIALGNLGRYDDELICIETALEIDPENANAWNSKGVYFYKQNKTEDAIKSYKNAILLDPEIPEIWYNKGIALDDLSNFTKAAMAYSLSREMELNTKTKMGIFAAFMIAYSALIAVGYTLSRRIQKYTISIGILSINSLGFLAIMWILSGFFDHLLIGQFFLGGVVMLVISTVLWSLSGFPANPWRNQIAQEIENFDEKCPRFSRFIRAVGLLSALSYAFMATIFYFRLHLGSETSMVDFLKIAFGSIFLLGLLVTLPPIWSAMISKNLDGRTRELLMIFQFGHLGLSGLYSGMILWIFGKGSFSHSLSLGDIKFPISIHSLGIVMFLFVLAVIIPYVSGSKRASRWNTTLFEKERRWLDELVDILDYPTPNLYVSKLQKVMAEIKGEDPISGQEEELDRIKSLYGAEVLRLDPRSRHREFSMKLQEQIAEMITQFEEIGDEEEKIKENAPIYADAYRLRRDEIIGMIEREGKFKPKFWIALAIILTPVLGQILATLINWILKAMIDTNLGGFITQTPVFPIPLPLP